MAVCPVEFRVWKLFRVKTTTASPKSVVDVCVQLIYIQHHQHHLMQHLSKLELEKGHLYAQLTEMKQKFANCSTENVRLQAQVQALQQQFDQRQQQGAGGGPPGGPAGPLADL